MKNTLHQNLNKMWVGCAIGILGMGLLALKQPSGLQDIDCQKITLRTADGKPCMLFDATSGSGSVKFFDKKGLSIMELSGGDVPCIVMKNKEQKELMQITLGDDGFVAVNLKDKQGIARMQLQGGDSPAIFLKNEQNEIIATLLTLQDGGTALGLGDKDGDVAAFMRGGNTPSISFFSKSVEPLAAIGVAQRVPHVLVTSPSTKDNLVIHGGDPTSVLFVDEQGEIPVLLSKHGLFQGKKPTQSSQEPKEDKVFTWEELLNPLKDLKLKKG